MNLNDPFHHVFQAMPLPCLLLKPAEGCYDIVDANELYLQLSGSAKGDLIGKTASQAFPYNPGQKEEGPTVLHESLKKVLKTGKKDKIDLLRYDIPVRGSNEFEEKHWSSENIPVLGKDGRVEFVLHVVKDVTPQVLALKNGQKMELQQRHFIENHPDGNFTTANEGLSEIAEVPLPELLKMNFFPFCHPEDQNYILQHFHKALAGETTKFEARFISARGRNMILQISLVPMKVNDLIEGAYGIAKDLTEIRESQKVIVEKKNFLQANAGFISNLLDNELENSSLEEAFAVIGNAVDADRMYYFEMHNSPESGEMFISQKIEWTSESIHFQRDNPEMQHIPATQIQQIMTPLSRNKPFTAILSDLPEGELRRIFINQGIKAMLLLPVFQKDTLHGFIGFDDCTRERRWNQEEITFLQSIAHNLTTTFEKRAAQSELKEREEALVQSEKKFKALVQEGSDLIAILDEKGNYKFVSETSTRILGIPPKAFIGKNAFDYIHPEDRSIFVEGYRALEVGSQVNLGPFRFRDQNNNWRWIETTATNLFNDPAVNGIVANSRDVTTIVNQAREIEHINERYRLAATATQDLMYDWDLVTDKVQRFHKTTTFLGYSVAEMNTRNFWRERIHPDELEKLKQHQAVILGNPDSSFINSEYRFRRADGTYAYFLDRAYILRDANGKAIRLVGATSDVSDLTAKKEALKVSNKRFKMAMKATNEMIWDWDISTGHIKRSKAFKEIYGYKNYKNHPVKNYWLNKIHDDERDAVNASISAALEDTGKKKWQEEYRFIRANGDIAHVIDRGYILRDKTGKAIRMVGAVLDVTASRHALQRIENQNVRLMEIAWEQSHIVRAPLARLQSLVHLVKTNEFGEMSYEEIWGHIEASANELDEIIRRIVKKSEEIEEDSVGKPSIESAYF